MSELGYLIAGFRLNRVSSMSLLTVGVDRPALLPVLDGVQYQ